MSELKNDKTEIVNVLNEMLKPWVLKVKGYRIDETFGVTRKADSELGEMFETKFNVIFVTGYGTYFLHHLIFDGMIYDIDEDDSDGYKISNYEPIGDYLERWKLSLHPLKEYGEDGYTQIVWRELKKGND